MHCAWFCMPASHHVMSSHCKHASCSFGLCLASVAFLNSQMASTIGSVQASGLLVRARQVCLPPQTRLMRMKVGRWHEADVPMVVKGTRPPMKVCAEAWDIQ